MAGYPGNAADRDCRRRRLTISYWAEKLYMPCPIVAS